MIFTLVVFLGAVVITCLIGVAVIPMFDRRAPLSLPPRAAVAMEPGAAPPRSA